MVFGHFLHRQAFATIRKSARFPLAAAVLLHPPELERKPVSIVHPLGLTMAWASDTIAESETVRGRASDCIECAGLLRRGSFLADRYPEATSHDAVRGRNALDWRDLVR